MLGSTYSAEHVFGISIKLNDEMILQIFERANWN